MSTFVFTLNLLFSGLFLQVKESKERAMSSLSPYRSAVSHDFTHDSNINSQQATDSGPSPFVSLLEFVSEVYQVSDQTKHFSFDMHKVYFHLLSVFVSHVYQVW